MTLTAKATVVDPSAEVSRATARTVKRPVSGLLVKVAEATPLDVVALLGVSVPASAEKDISVPSSTVLPTASKTRAITVVLVGVPAPGTKMTLG